MDQTIVGLNKNPLQMKTERNKDFPLLGYLLNLENARYRSFSYLDRMAPLRF